MNPLQETEMQLLRKDFIRFSQLHSWYKHLPLEGIPFYFYKRTGQQIRHPIDPMVEDEVGDHYHFVMGNSKDISNHFTVRFGPFLRGDGYGMDLIGRGEEDKKRLKEWLKKEYPDLYQKRERNRIDEEIFSSER